STSRNPDRERTSSPRNGRTDGSTPAYRHHRPHLGRDAGRASGRWVHPAPFAGCRRQVGRHGASRPTGGPGPSPARVRPSAGLRAGGGAGGQEDAGLGAPPPAPRAPPARPAAGRPPRPPIAGPARPDRPQHPALFPLPPPSGGPADLLAGIRPPP